MTGTVIMLNSYSATYKFLSIHNQALSYVF